MINNRTFASDNNLDQNIFNSSQATSVQTSLPQINESTLFKTARIFTKESILRSLIEKHGWFFICLHFSPFASPSRDRTEAKFSVSAHNFTLIKGYKHIKSSIIKEYSLNITTDTLSLGFRPGTGSFAFLNALEVFMVPEIVLPGETRVIDTQSQRNLNLGDHAMDTVLRVNMGNLNVSRDQDKLCREWDSDSDYIVEAHFGKPVLNLEAVNFSSGGVSNDIAPIYVYVTAHYKNEMT